MGLPTKRNKSLLLHYKPSFPGKKTKKKKTPKKTPKKQKLKQEKNGSTNERK